MNIFSRRKRMLNQTPARANADAIASTGESRRVRVRTRALLLMKALRIRGSKANRDSGLIASSRAQVRRAVRRNRVLLVTLLVVGGFVALLTGISMGQGIWTMDAHTVGPPAPPARFGAATAYDEANNTVVIFGGFVGTTSASQVGSVAGPPIVTDGKTYLFKGFQYQRRDPVRAPSSRGFAAMAYDGARRNVVLFGGATYRANPGAGVGEVYGDTWIWDENEWTLMSPPAPVPEPRQNAAMVYDAHRRVVMMFGGRGADGKPMKDTWVWNGKFWKIMPPEGAPSPRHSAAIAYDECRAETVMFGGVGDPVNNFHRAPSETWTWDGAKWTQKSPLVSPPGRIGAGMGYSRNRGRILLYGGLTTNDAGVPTAATDHEVWRWNGDGGDGRLPGTGGGQGHGGWEKMNAELTTATMGPCAGLFTNCVVGLVTVPPVPRAYASFATLGDIWLSITYRGHFLLFGGTPADSPNANVPQVALGDHFYFSEVHDGAAGHVVFGDGLTTDHPQYPPLPGNPLARRCVNPVPIPEDAPGAGEADVPQSPKTETREGIREIGRLPVLLGADWPAASRKTHVGPSNNRTPNPAYTPPPDCPNRSAPFATSGNSEVSANNQYGSNTHLATDSTRNRVYQFFICDNDRGEGYVSSTRYDYFPRVYNILIEAYDGTTLEPLGRVIARGVNVSAGDLKTLIHDPVQDRFLVRTSTPFELVSIQQDRIEKGLDPVVGRYTFSASDLSGKTFMNFFRHPTTGRAKLFYSRLGGGATPGPPPATSTPPRLGQWNLEAMKSDWEAPLASTCTRTGGVAMHSGERVYTACNVGNNQWAVVRISLTSSTDGSETPGTAEVFPGPTSDDDGVNAWGDPQAERMTLIAKLTSEPRIWTFDGKTSRWVGRTGVGQAAPSSAALGSAIKFGFDDSAGRLYVYMTDSPVGNTRGGVRILDTRLTPVAQPVDFPQFASTSNVDPAFLAGPGGARRVFINVDGGKMRKYPNWETVEFENEMFYRVLADEVPVPKALNLSDLDALTVPVPETPGKTEVSFDAEGSAYGIRLRSIGGIWTAARPFQQMYSGIDPWENLALSFTGRHLIPACVFPDRELMAGFVLQARLSDLDALARSSGLEVDSNSKVDLTGPSSRCQPTADANNFPASIKVVFDILWPLKLMVESQANEVASSGVTAEAGQQSGATTEHLDTPLGTLDVFKDAGGKPTGATATTTSSAWDKHFKEVVCVGDALKTYQAAVGNIYGSSDCIQTQGLVKATARGSATGVGPLAEEATKQGFSVGEGYSNVIVSRDPVRGVVVTSTATAKGIQIPGLSIDRVETTAVAWSNGRPGEERALFTRDICGVHTPDGSIPGCLSSGNQQEFVTRWNSGWGKNSQIYLPQPDPGYYNGSPGGYIAGVLKPLANEIEDQLFAKDFQKEVPAIEIHFYKDSQSTGEARQTLQLAAVRAIAGFGVQCDPDYLYSPQTETTPATCVLIPEDLPEEEYWEEGEDEFYEEEESELDGEWIPADAIGPTGPSLGSRIGKLLENLPVIRQLPIRQIAEALLAGSVWWLLGLPLFLASRRFALSQWRTN